MTNVSHTISDAKLAANRRNALASTGPKSDEGKATVSGNARKHGLTMSPAYRDRLPEDQQAELATLEAQILEEYPFPSLASENLHAGLAWNLLLARRATEFEAEALASNDLSSLLRFTRYRLQLERQAERQRKALLTQHWIAANAATEAKSEPKPEFKADPKPESKPTKTKVRFSEEELAFLDLLPPEVQPAEPKTILRRDKLAEIHNAIGFKGDKAV